MSRSREQLRGGRLESAPPRRATSADRRTIRSGGGALGLSVRSARNCTRSFPSPFRCPRPDRHGTRWLPPPPRPPTTSAARSLRSRHSTASRSRTDGNQSYQTYRKRPLCFLSAEDQQARPGRSRRREEGRVQAQRRVGARHVQGEDLEGGDDSQRRRLVELNGQRARQRNRADDRLRRAEDRQRTSRWIERQRGGLERGHRRCRADARTSSKTAQRKGAGTQPTGVPDSFRQPACVVRKQYPRDRDRTGPMCRVRGSHEQRRD